MTTLSYAERLELRPPAPTPLRKRREPVPSQLLFRELNEEIAQRRPRRGEVIEAVCECERRGCTRGVRLSAEEYEAIRRFPTRFLMRRGHACDDGERVVEAHEGYDVIEKTGPAALVAIRLDPRRQRLSSGEAA